MNVPRVFQFHSGSAVGDAVTNSLFYVQDILSHFGIASKIFVEHRDPDLKDRLCLIGEFRPRPDDLLLIHHSMGHEIMPLLSALPCRKVLIYHNITPPAFFDHDPVTRKYAMMGLQQLEALRKCTIAAIADSDFNADELRRRGYDSPVTIPLLRDFTSIRFLEFNPTLQYFETPRYQLLFVGRISANKGQLHLVDFLDEYRDAFDYPLYLTLVGRHREDDLYASELLKKVEQAGLGDRIVITGHVSEKDLYGYFRAADAYVSFSEHEGFGVPLLEAMAFDVPVVAFETSAIGDTLGTAGIKLKTTEPDELAEQLARLFSNRSHRRKVIRGQRTRLMDFERATVAARLLEFLGPYLPTDVVPRAKDHASEAAGTRRANDARRQYIIEGPCETTYSLAITNRNLALGLNEKNGTEAMLVPMEGTPGYKLNAEAVRDNPAIIPLLRPLPLSPEGSVVSLRNMYPLRPAGMLGDYRIAANPWEESEISPAMVRLMNRYLDGVAATTSFVRDVYRNSGVRVPMDVYGHGLDHLPAAPVSRRADKRQFVFLHISSGLARKGIEELFIAYASAFKRDENVQLVVKTFANETNVVRSWYDKLFTNNRNAPSIRIIFDDLSIEQMHQLYSDADAVVLPTRGEGFNYPAAEAFKYELPLVVTGHTGHMDFCDDGNSYLVDYDFELSTSHLAISESMWVRARIDDLAVKMRAVVEDAGTPELGRRVMNAKARAAEMTWAATTAKIEQFVDTLERPRAEKRKLKVAWVSTWNSRCGIAAYSEFMLSHLPERWFDLTVFANQTQTLRPDSSYVSRNWTDRLGSLDDVVKDAIEGEFDVVVFQYNYGFHTLSCLAAAVMALNNAKIDTHIFFHRTEPAIIDGATESIAHHADAFRRATRVVVHSVDDINRLKEYGLVDNVMKLPHGALRHSTLDQSGVRRLLGFERFAPVIGSYGFLVPHKGILELIFAFALIVGKHPDALLLLVNSANPDPASEIERSQCEALVRALNLTKNVVLVTEFLEEDESHLLLQACDIVVFSYQYTAESSSAAVRHGLSSLRPVLTTPLPIFDNVRELVYQSKGISALEIADAVETLLADTDLQNRLKAKQAEWLSQHDWSTISERFANMVIGLHEDGHDVTVVRDVPVPRGGERKSTSAEERSWAEQISDEAFVRIAFQRAMGRDASPEDVARHVQLLRDESRKRAELLSALESSEEGRARATAGREAKGFDNVHVPTIPFDELDVGENTLFVDTLYRRLLNRAPDPGGFEQYLGFLRAGGNRRKVVESMLTSEEFRHKDRPIRILWGDDAQV